MAERQGHRLGAPIRKFKARDERPRWSLARTTSFARDGSSADPPLKHGVCANLAFSALEREGGFVRRFAASRASTSRTENMFRCETALAQNKGVSYVDKPFGAQVSLMPDSKDGLIQLDGIVTKVLPATMYRVKLGNGHEILAHISGKMRKNFIKIMQGDRVTVEMSPYDLTKGRITFRHKT